MKFEGFDICKALDDQPKTAVRLKCRTCDVIFVYDVANGQNLEPMFVDSPGEESHPPKCPGCGKVGRVLVVPEPDADYRMRVVRAVKALGVGNAEEVVAKSGEFVGEYAKAGHPWVAAALGVIWTWRPKSVYLRIDPQGVIDEDGKPPRMSMVRVHAATEAAYREWANDLMKARESVILSFQGKHAPKDQQRPTKAELFTVKAQIGKHKLLIPAWASDMHTLAQAVLDCIRHKASPGDYLRVEHWKQPPGEYLIFEHLPPEQQVETPPKPDLIVPPPEYRA